MLLHVRIEDLEKAVRLSVVNEIAVDISSGTSSINRYVRGIFSSLCKTLLRESRSVYISALARKNKKIKKLNCRDRRPYGDKKSANEGLRVSRQTVIPPSLESSVVSVYRAARLRLIRLIESKQVAQGGEQVISARNVAIILR